MKHTRSQHTFLLVIFFVILMTPNLDYVFNFSPVKDLFEKRLKVERPQPPTNLKELKAYPRKYEDFFNDNYGFRKTLIYWHSKIMDKVFNESPNERVVRGKEKWLFFDNKNSLLDAQGRITLDQKMLDRGVEALAQNWRQLKAMNVDYLLVIAADKSSIYSEFMPDYIDIKAGNRRADQFLKALQSKYPDFPVLDLRPVLLQAKATEKLYHETDTHWNKRGAHYGYVEIMNMLGKKPRVRSEFKDVASNYYRGDISDMMGSDVENLDYSLEPKFQLSSKQERIKTKQRKNFYKPTLFVNEDTSLPRLFVFHDSFFGELFWLVSEHFSRSFYINEHPCQINLEVIKKDKSNVVIHEFWEGRLVDILKSCK